jgi:hypothetical protein
MPVSGTERPGVLSHERERIVQRMGVVRLSVPTGENNSGDSGNPEQGQGSSGMRAFREGRGSGDPYPGPVVSGFGPEGNGCRRGGEE